MYNRENSIGVTLIETMLALFLGLFIISALLEIYLISQNSYNTQIALHAVQENGRAVSDMLAAKIRMAGVAGCAHFSNDFSFINHTSIQLNEQNKIALYQTTEMKSGTDGFVTWHGGESNLIMVRAMGGKKTFFTTKKSAIKAGDFLFISDCATTELIQVQRVSVDHDTQKIIAEQPLDKLYQQGTDIIPLEMDAYFVADTGRVDAKNQSIYALYEKNIKGEEAELIEGIDQMKMKYSTVEQSGMAEHPFTSIINGEKVKGLSFELLLSSLPPVVLQKKWYLYAALREV